MDGTVKTNRAPSWEEYESLMERCGLRQVDLAEELWISRQTIYRWKDHGVPLYAVAYLRLKKEYLRMLP